MYDFIRKSILVDIEALYYKV